MAPRTKFIAFVATSWLAVFVVLYFLTLDPYSDAWERYLHIHVGMSEADVVSTFGVASGEHNAIPVTCCGTGQDDDIAAVNACHTQQLWIFDAGMFEFGFDEQGRVQHKVASANMNRPNAFARVIHLLTR
jgi:hypothetical protein